MSHRLFEELEHRIRGLVLRMKPTAIDDRGETQKASGRVLHNVHRSDVEVIQPHGFSSVPPAGSMMVVIAVGGDQGDLVGLPISAPQGRMGGLAPGESVHYGPAGQRVHMKADGSVDVRSATAVTMKTKDMTVAITNQGVTTWPGGSLTLDGAGASLTANLTVTGNIVHTGNFASSGGSFTHNGKNVGSTHVHKDVLVGPANTGVPV